jgi:hypothetical protein
LDKESDDESYIGKEKQNENQEKQCCNNTINKGNSLFDKKITIHSQNTYAFKKIINLHNIFQCGLQNDLQVNTS